jgi:hypothetical protein
VPSAFGQIKRIACSDDLNSKYIILVASMNVDVSLVAAQPLRSGYRGLSTLSHVFMTERDGPMTPKAFHALLRHACRWPGTGNRFGHSGGNPER